MLLRQGTSLFVIKLLNLLCIIYMYMNFSAVEQAQKNSLRVDTPIIGQSLWIPPGSGSITAMSPTSCPSTEAVRDWESPTGLKT